MGNLLLPTNSKRVPQLDHTLGLLNTKEYPAGWLLPILSILQAPQKLPPPVPKCLLLPAAPTPSNWLPLFLSDLKCISPKRDPSPLTLGFLLPQGNAPFTLGWESLPSLLGYSHLSPQDPTFSEWCPPQTGVSLPTVKTSTLLQGLLLPTMKTSAPTKNRLFLIVTFSTLTQDSLLPTKGRSTFDPGEPPPHNGIFYFRP